MEYHKIQSVFKRHEKTKRFTKEFSMPEFDYLQENLWMWTEKIDGTNIRIIWDGAKVRFGGRTDEAQIPATLIAVLQEMFPEALMLKVFGDRGGIVLYGEGYGAKIQSGGNYIPDGQSFILFDISAGDVWFERPKVGFFAEELGIKIVPIIALGSLESAIDFVRNGFKSEIGTALAEGLVLRPLVEMRTRMGERIITKIKHRDFIW